MRQSIGLVALVVRDYDEAIAFYVGVLGFWRDFHGYSAKGVAFVRSPKEESYGTVAVFQDPYGTFGISCK